MRLYNRLYVGTKARKKKERIISHLKQNQFLPDAYVITPSLSGNNILDIYPTPVLSLPRHQAADYLVLGIAADYWESLVVVRDIIDEMYRLTGDFDLEQFLILKEKHSV